MSTDRELLQAFIESHSDAAFRDLVQRHLPLVYSAAWRYLGDAHGAQDVSQAVFTLLARKARLVRNHPTLAGWLYTSTYHLATKAHRAEIRRARREQEALAMQAEATTIEFERLRPVIDDALMELKEVDRTAILLRFFEDRTYAEIGAQLGLAENAVRMRIERALDRVRVAVEKHGVESTAGAIGLALAAQTAGAVPAGLAATIAAASMSVPVAGALVFLMSSTFLKSAAVAALVVAGATGLVVQRNEIQRLRAENVRLANATKRPQPRSMSAASASIPGAELDRLRAQVAQLKGSPAASWQERAERLREVLAGLSEQNIPEIALATDDDWLDAARGKLDSADDYRRALAKLRNTCVEKFSAVLQPAIRAYVAANGGKFPETVAALQPYLKENVDPAILAHYVIAPASAVENVGVGDKIIIPASVVDPTYDLQYVVGSNGRGSTTYGTSSLMVLERTYKKEHGKWAASPAELLPYATTDREKAAIKAALERRSQGED